MFQEIPAEQLRDALERVSGDVLADAGVDAPPVDARDLARRLGVTVALGGATRDGATPRARFVRLGGAANGRPTVLLADEPRGERRQWAIAHEIGEAAAHRVFAELDLAAVDAPPAAREAVANRLAGCLLLPREWFAADGAACDWDLFILKSRYSTASHELIARRMLEMPRPVIITLWDQGRQIWRRSNLPGRTPPLAACERDARQVAHDCGGAARCEACELPDGVVDVRAWPVHEPGWKREILRMELGEAW